MVNRGDLPLLVEVREGAEKRLYVLNGAGRKRCGAMLQGLPEELAREIEGREPVGNSKG